LILLALLVAAPAAGQSWQAALDVAGPAAVRLQMELPDGTTSSCSGVVLDAVESIVLTAAHCVDAERLDVIVDGRHAELVRRNRVLDLAILRVRLKNAVAIDVSTTAPGLGALIAVLGFPLGAEDLTIQVGVLANPGGAKSTRADIAVDVLPGDSGGPVVDLTGRLVGITTGYRVAGAAHLGRMVPLAAVRAFAEDFIR
jgi:serine protease Do